jgi:hypothetical protein
MIRDEHKNYLETAWITSIGGRRMPVIYKKIYKDDTGTYTIIKGKRFPVTLVSVVNGARYYNIHNIKEKP